MDLVLKRKQNADWKGEGREAVEEGGGVLIVGWSSSTHCVCVSVCVAV